MIDGINQFTGRYQWLSNFWILNPPIKFEELEYQTVEHAFQASKTLDESARIPFSNFSGSVTPGYAKQLGRQLELRRDWEQVKLQMMEHFVSLKFNNNDLLASRLVATGDAILTEGNTWGDKFWGVCDGEGLNWLGLILMRVRDEL